MVWKAWWPGAPRLAECCPTPLLLPGALLFPIPLLDRDLYSDVPYKVFILCSYSLPLIIYRILDSFDMVPGHLTEDLHLYSLNDLTATRKGVLGPRLAELTRVGAAHVERCMVSKSLSLGLGPC